MANAGVINQAQKQFQQNSGINQANQDKLARLAKQYGEMAETEAKKVGVNMNLNQVMNKINSQYGQKTENAIHDASNKVQQTLNDKRFETARKQASKATFNNFLAGVEKKAKQLLNKVSDPETKKSLNDILKSGSNAARIQLKKNKLLNANIKNTVNIASNSRQVKQQQSVIRQKINNAISKL